MAKHVHADLIHAYADGAKIQFKENSTWKDISHPQWFEDCKYRIKPSIEKKSGWVIVCKNKKTYVSSTIYCCKKEAEANMPVCGVDIVSIEWEEEV